MRLCQRYFEKSYAYGTAIGSSTGNANIQNSVIFNAGGAWGFSFAVEKRVPPTLNLYNPNNGALNSLPAVSSNTLFAVTPNSDTGTKSVGTISVTSGTQGLTLYYHFTANADY